MEEQKPKPNYIVHFNAMSYEPVSCNTVDEVLDAIGGKPFTVGFWVESPTGLSVEEFIHF